MFRTPCALRSAHCAAIIALAAAAGVSRFETQKGQADRDKRGHDGREASSSNLVRPEFHFTAGHFSFIWQACVRALGCPIAPVSSDDSRDSDARATASDPLWAHPPSPTSRPAVHSPLPLGSSPATPGLRHGPASQVLPWSVGPPPPRIRLKPSADRTPVPGDFAARSRFDLRVALPPRARPWRARRAGIAHPTTAIPGRNPVPSPCPGQAVPRPERSNPGPLAASVLPRNACRL